MRALEFSKIEKTKLGSWRQDLIHKRSVILIYTCLCVRAGFCACAYAVRLIMSLERVQITFIINLLKSVSFVSQLFLLSNLSLAISVFTLLCMYIGYMWPVNI